MAVKKERCTKAVLLTTIVCNLPTTAGNLWKCLATLENLPLTLLSKKL